MKNISSVNRGGSQGYDFQSYTLHLIAPNLLLTLESSDDPDQAQAL